MNIQIMVGGIRFRFDSDFEIKVEESLTPFLFAEEQGFLRSNREALIQSQKGIDLSDTQAGSRQLSAARAPGEGDESPTWSPVLCSESSL